jgi:hypothetical protein
MTGALNMGSNKITAVTDPTNAQDAATKAYVDANIPSTANFLTKTNNLSDVSNATTARGNLTAAKSGANSDITSITGLTTPLTVAQGGIGAATLTANNVLLGNGTSAPQFVAPGTTGNVLTSNGTTWTSAAASGGSGFDAGTRMMFAQTSAPTGWTKDTTNYNNHAIRVVTGAASTGGSVDFTTAFASGLSDNAVTLSTSQIPSHTHTLTSTSGTPNSGCNSAQNWANISVSSIFALNSGSTGGGGSHTHTLPSFAVKYLDVITATKN